MGLQLDEPLEPDPRSVRRSVRDLAEAVAAIGRLR